MKVSPTVYPFFLLLLCIMGIVMISCNHSAKGPGQNQPTLKKIDKNILLNIIAELAKTISKKDASAADGIKLLKSYSSTYDLIINRKPKNISDTGFVFVDIYDNKMVMFFTFNLPKSLHQQVTFVDLKNKFGEWILSPLPIEYVYIKAMFQLKNAPDVFIHVHSKGMPGSNNNSIEEIEVSRLKP